MNNIIKDVEDLKEKVLNSDEYKDYIKYRTLLDNSVEINEIIDKIKETQQTIIKNNEIQKNTDKEELELESLYKKLNSYEDYTNYINSSKKLNEIITYIQKEFENYFNKFVI